MRHDSAIASPEARPRCADQLPPGAIEPGRGVERIGCRDERREPEQAGAAGRGLTLAHYLRAAAVIIAARGPALRPPARPLRLGAGAAPGLAVHLRRRLPLGARRLDPAALRDLRAVRGLHHAGPVRDDPAVRRHAELARDGLRPRDGLDARAAGEPPAALVPPGREAARPAPLVAVLQVYAFLAVACFWEVEPPPIGYLTVLPALVLAGFMLGALGLLVVLGDQAARELRRRDELRHLPDVLRLLGALPAVAGARSPACCSGRSARPTRSATRSS